MAEGDAEPAEKRRRPVQSFTTHAWPAGSRPTLSLKTQASVGTSNREVKKGNDLGPWPNPHVFEAPGAASDSPAGLGGAAYVVQKWRPHLGQTQN